MKKKTPVRILAVLMLLGVFIAQGFCAGASVKAAISIGNRDYVFYDSSSRYLQQSELYYLSNTELRVARNEIYARHGRLFANQELQNYFYTKWWYRGTVSPNNFNDNWLNQYETYNVQLIKNYEQARQ